MQIIVGRFESSTPGAAHGAREISFSLVDWIWQAMVEEATSLSPLFSFQRITRGDSCKSRIGCDRALARAMIVGCPDFSEDTFCFLVKCDLQVCIC